MTWIYLSPHLDDAALSCGGLIYEQTRAGAEALVWTICAGDPPPGPLSPFARSLHARWDTGREAIAVRRAEDRRSVERLGAFFRHEAVPDCIYRRDPQTGAALYASEEALWSPVAPAEQPLIAGLRARLSSGLEHLAEPRMVLPLALGKHVDHRLTRQAAEGLDIPRLYYADYPYVLDAEDELQELRQAGWSARTYPVSEAGLAAWQAAVAAHRSQISTFWPDLDAMYAALAAFCRRMGGVQLWAPPGEPFPAL